MNLSQDDMQEKSIDHEDGLHFRTPIGLEDVSQYPALFVSLLASGTWSLDDLKKLAGLNFLRVFREVQQVRSRQFLASPFSQNSFW